MARATIFVKGNSDVADALFACGEGDERWGGINEALRAVGSADRARVRHETMTRSDALLEATGDVPEALADLPFDWPYGTSSQFGAAFFDGGSDALVLSILPDVTTTLLRHRPSGRLFHPGPTVARAPELRLRLKAECDRMPLLEPERSMDNLAGIVARVRERSSAPVLVFNLSSVVPGDRLSSHRGMAETLSVRIRRFNLALIELARLPGVHIVDVDRVIASAGAAHLKLDGVRVNVAGSRLVAEETRRILADAGVFDPTGRASATVPKPTDERIET